MCSCRRGGKRVSDGIILLEGGRDTYSGSFDGGGASSAEGDCLMYRYPSIDDMVGVGSVWVWCRVKELWSGSGRLRSYIATWTWKCSLYRNREDLWDEEVVKIRSRDTLLLHLRSSTLPEQFLCRLLS